MYCTYLRTCTFTICESVSTKAGRYRYYFFLQKQHIQWTVSREFNSIAILLHGLNLENDEIWNYAASSIVQTIWNCRSVHILDFILLMVKFPFIPTLNLVKQSI